MNYLENVNNFLNKNWKMTDQYCKKCQVAYFLDPEQGKMHCPNCSDIKNATVKKTPNGINVNNYKKSTQSQ